MTDKQIPASKLLALIKDSCEAGAVTSTAYVVLEQDLQALINEAPKVGPFGYVMQPAFWEGVRRSTICQNKHGSYQIPVFTVPQPSHTELIRGLVSALASLVDKELFCTDREIIGGIEVDDVLTARTLLAKAREVLK